MPLAEVTVLPGIIHAIEYLNRKLSGAAGDLERPFATGALLAIRGSDKRVKAGAEPLRGDGGQ